MNKRETIYKQQDKLKGFVTSPGVLMKNMEPHGN